MAATCALAALTAFAAALVIVRALVSSRLAHLVVDIPNARSLHEVPTPRTGGLGLVAAALLTWALYAKGETHVVVALAAALGALFVVDDVRGLPVGIRFTAQAAAAVGFVAWLAPAPLFLAPLLVVGIVWSANLYNFMDGSNGLAGGMTVIGFTTMALAALGGADSGAAKASELAVACAAVGGAAAGFLVWNFDPARIFLGDAGSIPLGFLAAALGLLGWQIGAFPFWLPLLVFSPFWIDATFTLLQRACRGEKLSDAHRSHYYQRLIRMGWSHRRLALFEYVLMIAVGGTALLVARARPLAVIAVLAWWVATYATIAAIIDWCWERHERSSAVPPLN